MPSRPYTRRSRSSAQCTYASNAWLYMRTECVVENAGISSSTTHSDFQTAVDSRCGSQSFRAAPQYEL